MVANRNLFKASSPPGKSATFFVMLVVAVVFGSVVGRTDEIDHLSPIQTDHPEPIETDHLRPIEIDHLD